MMAVLGLAAKQDFCTKFRVDHESELARNDFRANLLASKVDMSRQRGMHTNFASGQRQIGMG